MVYGHSLLPTKTSCLFIQLFGMLPSLDRTFSQVFTTNMVNPLFFYLGRGYLSSVSLSLIVCNHLELISW